jgi:hypothetical protein
MTKFYELVKNPQNDGDFVRIAFDERNSLVLNGLPLARFQRSLRIATLIQKQSLHSEGRLTAGPVTLLGDLHAAMPDLDAELFTVLGCPKAFELNIDRVKRIVFFRHPDRGVDHQLAMTLTCAAVLRGQINILEPAPATHIQTQDILKIVSLGHRPGQGLPTSDLAEGHRRARYQDAGRFRYPLGPGRQGFLDSV